MVLVATEQNVYCYADDIALVTVTKNALQHMRDMVAPILENFSIQFNS